MRKRPPVNQELVEELSYPSFKTDIEGMLTIQKNIRLLMNRCDRASLHNADNRAWCFRVNDRRSSLFFGYELLQLLFHPLDPLKRANLLKDEFFYPIEEMGEERVAA